LRDQHEAELTTVIDEQRKTTDAIEHYLQAFENGTLDESLFGERIKALSARSTELRARREELEDAIANETVPMPSREELQVIRNIVATALKEGDAAAQKRLVQEVVQEIRVQDRGHIVPIFRIPTTDETPPNPKVREMEGCGWA